MTQSEENGKEAVTLDYILGIDTKKDGIGTMMQNPMYEGEHKVPVGNIKVMIPRILKIFTSKRDDDRKKVVSWIKDKKLTNLNRIGIDGYSSPLLHWAARNGAEDLAVALVETYPEMINSEDIIRTKPMSIAYLHNKDLCEKLKKAVESQPNAKEILDKVNKSKYDSHDLRTILRESILSGLIKGGRILTIKPSVSYIDRVIKNTDIKLFTSEITSHEDQIKAVKTLSKIIYDHHTDFKGEGKEISSLFDSSEASTNKLCQLDPAYEVVKKAVTDYNESTKRDNTKQPRVQDTEMDRQIGKILKVLRSEGMNTDMIKEAQAMLTTRLIDKAHKKSTLKGGGFTIEAKDLIPYAKTLVLAKETKLAAQKKEELLKLASTTPVKKKGTNLSLE